MATYLSDDSDAPKAGQQRLPERSRFMSIVSYFSDSDDDEEQRRITTVKTSKEDATIPSFLSASADAVGLSSVALASPFFAAPSPEAPSTALALSLVSRLAPGELAASPIPPCSEPGEDPPTPSPPRKHSGSSFLSRSASAPGLYVDHPPTPTTARSRRCSSRGRCPSTPTRSGNVVVACRFRPMISREVRAGELPVAEFPSRNSVQIDGRLFTLDRVFPPDTPQAEVYEEVAKPVVCDILKGYNGTVMAYGPTGSGKTYTMEGRVTEAGLSGVVPRMVSTLFDEIDRTADTVEYMLRLSAVEIYMEQICDLLARPTQPQGGRTTPRSAAIASAAAALDGRSPVKVHEDAARGVWIDAEEQVATSEADVFAAAHIAQARRRVGVTRMNQRSSRSHYIFMLRLTAREKQTRNERQGLLYLVDLAGSESARQNGAEGQTFEEARKINRSLSCLCNVISALTSEDRDRAHVPYRDSKLTRVLQQSLGGNAKTALVTTCSPASSCVGETLTALRFSERAKRVRNTPCVNEQKSLEQLMRNLDDNARTIAALEKECAKLKAAAVSGTGIVAMPPVQLMRPPVAHQSCQVGGQSPPRNPDSGLLDLSPSAMDQRALLQLRSELIAVRHERDAAREQLGLMDTELSRPPEEAAADTVRQKPEQWLQPPPEPAQRPGAGLVKRLQEENAELKRQLLAKVEPETSLAAVDGSPGGAGAGRPRSREHVLQLQDSVLHLSQERDFLQREVEELQQLLQACCSGELRDERMQWLAMLEGEKARREVACGRWREYLSNRIHKVVELEMQVDTLRDQLLLLGGSLPVPAAPSGSAAWHSATGGECMRLRQDAAGQPEVTGGDETGSESGGPPAPLLPQVQPPSACGSWLQRLPLAWAESPAGRANIARPVRRAEPCQLSSPAASA